ncbi:MAG TPA: SPOR domain-containing protein [Thermoanaerobaculia bacterium]|nr:SPOR domain-containing protein [Thermoanaerobaculia bacterium]
MEQVAEDQSHYEISLTAGQAFVAFVLLLLSLAASFAFGLMVGRGNADDRLVLRKEPVTEAAVVPKKPPAKIETHVRDEDFKAPPTTIEPSVAAGASPAAERPRAAAPTPDGSPAFAQLLSTTDQKTAEALAAKLIERGFTAAYVERTTSDKGPTFRVRVKFPTETEARAAEPKLKEFSKEVWITR